MASGESDETKRAGLATRMELLAAEGARLRAALVENIQESRRLIEQLDELQVESVVGRQNLRGIQLNDLETAAILNSLEAASGNRTHAARMLGISVRTIQRKLKSMGWLEDGAAHNGGRVQQRAS